MTLVSWSEFDLAALRNVANKLHKVDLSSSEVGYRKIQKALTPLGGEEIHGHIGVLFTLRPEDAPEFLVKVQGVRHFAFSGGGDLDVVSYYVSGNLRSFKESAKYLKHTPVGLQLEKLLESVGYAN